MTEAVITPLLNAIERYKVLLGLERWNIDVRFDEKLKDAGNCDYKPEYMQATISFNPKDISLADVDEYARHELLHCIVAPLAQVADFVRERDKNSREMVREAEERVVSQLELLPLWDELESH